MIRVTLCLVCAAFAACPASAAQAFSCGGADVSIVVIARDSPIWEQRAESVVTVSRDGYSTTLRYRNVDFIGGKCVNRPNAKSVVVFQAYCGGSGCRDGANWGVIDPEVLRVLAVPSDFNRDEVQKILGDRPMPDLRMMSVLEEARTLGIRVP